MKRPTKALILAAGFGTRLYPLTDLVPKPLIPFEDLPLMEHAIRMLADWGVTEIVINTHHLAEQIEAFVDERLQSDDCRVKLSISHEPQILGTGGAIRNIEWFFQGQPIWVFNSDVLAKVDPEPILARHAEADRPLATLWMVANSGPMTVELEEGGVSSFRSEQPGANNTYTFSGLHLLEPDVLSFLPEAGTACSIIPAYEKAMQQGRVIGGAVSDASNSPVASSWYDLGTPEAYLAAHQSIRPGNFIAPGVTIPVGTRIERSVVWPGAKIFKSAVIRDAIIAHDTIVNGEVSRIALPVSALCVDAETDALASLGWDLSQAAAVCLAPRGSDRDFFRLYDGEKKAILMRNGTDRVENDRFALYAEFLKEREVAVPEIFINQPADRFLLVEDLGTTDLLAAVRGKSMEEIEARYYRILEEVARFHALKVPKDFPLQPAFNPELYRWEYDLFIREFVIGRLEVETEEAENIRAELERELMTKMQKLPLALIHRDLQSTNILFRDGRPVLIDFQGMRLGPALYDVASLISDPYIHLPEEMQRRLVQAYLTLSEIDYSYEDYLLARIQRLIQALGAYGRLGRSPKTKRFLTHIPPAIDLLDRAVQQLGGFENLQEVL